MLTPRPHRRATNLALVAAALAVVGGGCEPQPTFPSNDPTLASIGGVVLFEQAFVTDGKPVRIDGSLAIFDIPADVAPVGTSYTLRLIHDVALTLPDAGADVVWSWDGRPLAVQVAPPSVTFTHPIRLETSFFPSDDHPAGLDVLHAASTESTWRRVGAAPQVNPPFNNDAIVLVEGAGLWSVAHRRVARQPTDGGSDASLD